MAKRKKKAPKNSNSASIGYEAGLPKMANALRRSMGAAEYKHVVLGLVRDIHGQIAYGDIIHDDRRSDLKADFLLANPPLNTSDWGSERLAGDTRWQYGTPPGMKLRCTYASAVGPAR